MTIKREDLVAAASVGLLPCRQVDPLLVFLLQRDVRAKREALQAQSAAHNPAGKGGWLSWLIGLLAVVAAAWLAGQSTHAGAAVGGGTLLVSALLYVGAALALAAWFRRRGFGARVRLLVALAMASLPLAVLALQQVSR
jgi:hypothetical protein